MMPQTMLALVAAGALALGLAGCMNSNGKEKMMKEGDMKMEQGRMMRDKGMRMNDEPMEMKGERMMEEGQMMKDKAMKMQSRSEGMDGGGMAMDKPAMMSAGQFAGWPEASRMAAQKVTEKYGEPDGVTADMLVWNEKGPWKRIVVSRQEVPHEFPVKHTDVLEQAIDYRVPPDKFDDLAMYDGSVIVERTKGTMSARCDKEEANFLALNLAHDVVTGKRTARQARDFYAKTVMASLKGEKPPYMQKLQFQPPRGNTMDPDMGAMER